MVKGDLKIDQIHDLAVAKNHWFLTESYTNQIVKDQFVPVAAGSRNLLLFARAVKCC